MQPQQTRPDEPFRFASFGSGMQVLIQGASRGIGLQFVEQLLDCEQVDTVYAACRDPRSAESLLDLRRTHHDRLQLVPLDVTREDSIREAAAFVSGRSDRLHLLVNVAGLLHDEHGMRPEKRLADVRPENLEKSFRVNAFGPLLVAKHFQTLLGRPDRAILANMSARIGSIGDNRLGGWYAYRASKAAQNMFTRTLALEFRRNRSHTLCVALHPGTTDTGLSKPFQDNVPEGQLQTVAYTVRCLLTVLDGLKAQDSGGFFAFDGEAIEW